MCNHGDYRKEVRTINGAYNAEELRRLRQEICEEKKRKVDSTCSALTPGQPLKLLWLLRLNAAPRSFRIPHIL